ncbi:MAG: hypothetical protein ACLS36_05570 [Streptococcus sp.]
MEELKAIAQPVANKEAIAQVARFHHVLKKLVNTFQKLWNVGNDGVITIEESRGMRLNSKWLKVCSLTVVIFLSTWLLIMKKWSLTLKIHLSLVTDKKISNIQDVLHSWKKCLRQVVHF